jgi:hypothetical protein
MNFYNHQHPRVVLLTFSACELRGRNSAVVDENIELKKKKNFYIAGKIKKKKNSVQTYLIRPEWMIIVQDR